MAGVRRGGRPVRRGGHADPWQGAIRGPRRRGERRRRALRLVARRRDNRSRPPPRPRPCDNRRDPFSGGRESDGGSLVQRPAVHRQVAVDMVRLRAGSIRLQAVARRQEAELPLPSGARNARYAAASPGGLREGWRIVDREGRSGRRRPRGPPLRLPPPAASGVRQSGVPRRRRPRWRGPTSKPTSMRWSRVGSRSVGRIQGRNHRAAVQRPDRGGPVGRNLLDRPVRADAAPRQRGPVGLRGKRTGPGRGFSDIEAPPRRRYSVAAALRGTLRTLRDSPLLHWRLRPVPSIVDDGPAGGRRHLGIAILENHIRRRTLPAAGRVGLDAGGRTHAGERARALAGHRR